MSGQTRHRAISMGSGRSARSGAASAAGGKAAQEFNNTMPSASKLRCFDPSAATASMFLYAQGNAVVCCHHDTLTIERRFTRHAEEVLLLAVDNISEQGAGRLVMSYDASQTAIVWDLMTGDEIARFISYDALTAAAWMKNGNVAFGNAQGSIILFEPQTSEHISARTLDQIVVTALAPAVDCSTFAIGYQNGNLLIASLQPRFTVLHNLTTSRAPSPIVTLSWHASSSKQKSDMLAVQTFDGDLRVWSVSKSQKVEDPAKVVRLLKKTDVTVPGPNWMGWSKNGRIIQFSDCETLSWDVRTKHVTYDSIPTLEHVKGIAVYGPGASLFTLGPNCMVQQFDLNSPAIMVANVQHPANLLPPSPPNSIEEPPDTANSTTTINTSESESSSIPIEMGVSESDEDHMSPFDRIQRRARGGHESSGNELRYESASSASSRYGQSYQSMSSAGSRTPGRHPASMRSRGMTENTYISSGSTFQTSTIGKHQPQRELDNYSMGYSVGTTSIASSRSKRPSRLRNEVARSPEDGSSKVQDLFKFTRSRLSDMPYKHPLLPDNARRTNDDLRRQMLSSIFGWHGEVEDLVRDEMSRHPAGSASRILLAKWLGDIETDILAASSENMTSSDWMLLALSGIGGQASQQKLGQAYVQRLLESGDIHVAVTIMLGMGDFNDAIEVYISHRRYLEALILTCITFPSVWERQVAIIKKWGEWAVQHGEQHLAIRCFASAGQESTEPWASPSAAQLTFQSMTPSIPEVLSPPLSPPDMRRGPQRSIAKTSALRLITTFGDQDGNNKFFAQDDGGQTPLAAGVTPIAEVAFTPGGDRELTTALLRPSTNSRFNTPTSARPGAGRRRLPSIGENAADQVRAALQRNNLSTDESEASESSQQHRHQRTYSYDRDHMAAGSSLLRAATASPNMTRTSRHRAAGSGSSSHIYNKVDRPPSPDSKVMAKMQQARNNHRNGSRDRIPYGVNLQLRSLEQAEAAEDNSLDHSVASSARYHWPSRRRGPASVASSVTSASSVGRSTRGHARNRDDYIHSLDTASQHSRRARSRHASKERRRDVSRTRGVSRDRKPRSRDASEDRSQVSARNWNQAKRSPTSPLPMSPEDLANLGTPRFTDATEPSTVVKAGGDGARPKISSRASSRNGRARSPARKPKPAALDFRSRSHGRAGIGHLRSPSSPLPLTATATHYQGSEDEEDFQRAMAEQEMFRAKHSRSRGLNSPANVRQERSESRRRVEAEALDTLEPLAFRSRAISTEHAGDLRAIKEERQKKKDRAARELEDRRRSLAKRPQAPSIPHPDTFSPGFPRVGVEAEDERLPDHVPARCATEPPRAGNSRGGPLIGLPATPKAMRLNMDPEPNASSSDRDGSAMPPPPPPIPAMFTQPQPFAMDDGSHDRDTTGYHQSASLYRSGSERDEPQGHEEARYTEPATDASAAAPLTLLPSTVYQPPRPMIPRSMSAPIPDEPGPARWGGGRKGSTSKGELPGIDEVVTNDRSSQAQRPQQRRRRSQEELIPPPPPPAPQGPSPPMLRELQHLAKPPPPPPAPLPHLRHASASTGMVGNGAIEIVMDEDEEDEEEGTHHQQQHHAEPILRAAPNDHMVPVLPPPAPRSKTASGHSRGRSYGDAMGAGGSINARLSQATNASERMRSASRGGKEAPRIMSPPPVTYDQDAIRSPMEAGGKHMSTGLHRSEMI